MKQRVIQSVFAILVALALGYGAWVNAMGNILARSDPALALSIDDSNEFAYDTLGNEIVEKSLADEGGRAFALPYIHGALEISSGLPTSLRNYAILAGDNAVEGDAIAIMKLAAAFSKRDQLSVLWLIENTSRAGDIGATLKYYDQALTAEPELRTILFPVLAQAIEDPDLQKPIAGLIARKPEWSEGFISYMAREPKTVGNLVLLERQLTGRNDVITRSHRLAAGRNLIAQGQYEEAELLLRSSASLGGDLTVFTQDADGANPFQWALKSASTHAIRLQSDGQLRVVQYAGSGAPVANRIIMPKGRLQFRAILMSEGKDIVRMPVFLLNCIGTAKSFRISPQGRGEEGQVFYELNEHEPGCYFAKLTMQNVSNFSGREIAYSVGLISLRGRGK